MLESNASGSANDSATATGAIGPIKIGKVEDVFLNIVGDNMSVSAGNLKEGMKTLAGPLQIKEIEDLFINMVPAGSDLKKTILGGAAISKYEKKISEALEKSDNNAARGKSRATARAGRDTRSGSKKK